MHQSLSGCRRSPGLHSDREVIYAKRLRRQSRLRSLTTDVDPIGMFELQHKRRSFLLGLAGYPVSDCGSGRDVTQGYALSPDGGDHLVHYRNPGKIFIRADPTKRLPQSRFGHHSPARAGGGRQWKAKT